MSRRGFGLPVVLITVGVVALLANLGMVSFSPIALLALWPLVLVLIGVDLLVARRAPLAALALDLGVVAVGLALLVARPDLPTWTPMLNIGGGHCPDGEAQSSVTVPRDGAQRLSLRLSGGAGTFRVNGGASALVEASSNAATLYPRTSRSGESVEVRLSECFDGARLSAHDVQVRVANDLPLSLEVTGGAGTFELDLREVRLSDARLTNGASSTTLRLPPPRGEVVVRVTGGASSTSIELGGAEARVESTGGLTTLNVPTGSFGGVGRNNWETPGYGAAADRYSITVTGGVSTVTVR